MSELAIEFCKKVMGWKHADYHPTFKHVIFNKELIHGGLFRFKDLNIIEDIVKSRAKKIDIHYNGQYDVKMLLNNDKLVEAKRCASLNEALMKASIT